MGRERNDPPLPASVGCRRIFMFDGKAIQSQAWFKKGSGTFAGTARRVLRTKVPDPFLNHAQSQAMQDSPPVNSAVDARICVGALTR